MSTAWFQPFSFMASLPERVRDMQSFDSAYVLLHENLHYIQSITTLSGTYRFVRFWNVYTFAAKLRIEKNVHFTNADIDLLQKIWRKAHNEISIFDPEIGVRSVDIDAGESIPTGLQYLALPDTSKAFAYVKQLTNNDYRAFFYDIESLQESMAFAYEIWLGKDIPYYQVLLDSDEPAFFQYIMGLETVKEITQWKNETAIAGLTVFLADYALNHYSPSHAFINGARLIALQYSEPEEQFDFEAMLDLLNASLMFDEILEGIEEVNQYFTKLHERSQNSNDPFDRAVGAIVSVMIKALDKRLSDPTYFIRHILTDFGNTDFLKNFHIPLYLNNNEYVDTGIHPNRHEFVLFAHILHHRLLTIVDDQADKTCPYIDKSVCGFKKNHQCRSEPWLRMFKHEAKEEKPEVCLYRFVEHGLQHPAKSK